jgi:hypothetical protein
VFIIYNMFKLINEKAISVPIFDTEIYTNFNKNEDYLFHYISELISKSFNNLSNEQVKLFVAGLFKITDIVEYTNHLKDFLVSMKVYSQQQIEKDLQDKIDNDKLEKQKLVKGLIKNEIDFDQEIN